jgi:fimbrial chaperone protein
MLLAPTRDLVFFPRLLVLAPGAQRVIRVGLATSVGPVEKSYRIFIEELPPVETEQAAPADGGVRVRVRVGIPVFVQPAGGRAEPRLTGLGARQRRVMFELQNPGTVHVPPHRVRATGYGDDGNVLWERELGGWYVLAKSLRRYEIEIGPEDCSKTRVIGVDLGIGPDALTERLADVQQACAR